MAFKTWADVDGHGNVDRDKGEGPEGRCCNRSHVAADMLVSFHEMPEAVLVKVRTRVPSVAAVSEIYLCDGCREALRREEVLGPRKDPNNPKVDLLHGPNRRRDG